MLGEALGIVRIQGTQHPARSVHSHRVGAVVTSGHSHLRYRSLPRSPRPPCWSAAYRNHLLLRASFHYDPLEAFGSTSRRLFADLPQILAAGRITIAIVNAAGSRARSVPGTAR